MNWRKLTDRCEVMVNADRSLLANLLKEGEEEMTRLCNIYEAEHGETLSTETNTIVLPTEDEGDVFKKPIVVLHNGVKLKAMQEYDFYHKSDNSLHSGTPIGYAIKNNNLLLSHIARIGDKIKIKYYAVRTTHVNTEPIIIPTYQKDLCNYACYMATLKTDPATASSFLQLWKMAIEQINKDEGDREMLYTVREEI
tara:strand:- start:3913 stop:4500 length:588 start_codon:yes stop_codon:yes gene_type:complete